MVIVSITWHIKKFTAYRWRKSIVFSRLDFNVAAYTVLPVFVSGRYFHRIYTIVKLDWLTTRSVETGIFLRLFTKPLTVGAHLATVTTVRACSTYNNLALWQHNRELKICNAAARRRAFKTKNIFIEDNTYE